MLEWLDIYSLIFLGYSGLFVIIVIFAIIHFLKFFNMFVQELISTSFGQQVSIIGGNLAPISLSSVVNQFGELAYTDFSYFGIRHEK